MRRALAIAGVAAATAVPVLALAPIGLASAAPVMSGSAASAGAHRQPAAPVAAWWTETNAGHGLPALPSPDVSGKQLLVQGSNAAPSLGAISTAPTSAQAIAGIRWNLPAHARPTTLKLSIAGTPPPAVTVEACQAKGSFSAVSGGAWSKVPAYDCSHPVLPTLKGSTITFAGIGRLAVGHDLAILLVPGPLDRVVLAPPTSKSLTVSHPPSLPPPPKGGNGNGGSQPGGSQPPAGNSGTGGSGGGLSGNTGSSAGGAPPPPSNPKVGQPGGSGQPPQVASSNPPNSAPQAAPAAARSVPMPLWRRLAAGLVIAAEVLAFALVQWRRRHRPATAGPGGEQPGRGVGRFVRQRESRPVAL